METVKAYIVKHDNGCAGQFGYTEYSEHELNDRYKGSLDALVAEYEEKGIMVYGIDILNQIRE